MDDHDHRLSSPNSHRCCSAVAASSEAAADAAALEASESVSARLLFLQNTRTLGYPLLRGKIHLLLVYLSPIWLAVLLRCASSVQGYLAALVAGTSALVQFSASAALHNGMWSAGAIERMAKMDYATIFVMIAGSCVPVPALLLPRLWTWLCMGVQLLSAFVGACCICNGYLLHAPKRRSLLYVTVGLTNVLFLPLYIPVMTAREVACLLATGALYITGSFFYAMKWPTLSPRVFGYHELFHLCCFAAACCTYAINRSVLLRAG